MAMKDGVNDMSHKQVFNDSIDNIAQASTKGVDRLGFGSLTFVATVDCSGQDTATLVLDLEDSDDDKAYHPVQDVNIVYPYHDGGEKPTLKKTYPETRIGYLGDKRYVKIKGTKGGTTAGTKANIIAIFRDPMVMPTN